MHRRPELATAMRGAASYVPTGKPWKVDQLSDKEQGLKGASPVIRLRCPAHPRGGSRASVIIGAG